MEDGMKELKILGGGCAKCGLLYKNTEEAAKALGIAYRIEKITDFQIIARYGVVNTPALVVDDEIVLSGSVPSAKELEKYLK
jgi:small redox-active disulfide protein 2